MKQAIASVLLISAFQLFSLSAFGQGSLAPPGAPAPTMKTLDQVEPRIDLQNAPASVVTTTNADYHFIITQPGSYYLSANLAVTKTNGIQINAEGVTLDLNGFQISRSSGTGGNGIEITSPSDRASIRNGSLKGFGYGIRSVFSGGFAFARGCGFRDLSVSNCTIAGIFAGRGAVLESCRAHNNSGVYGIYADNGSSLTNCSADDNVGAGGSGIFANSGSSLTNCVAASNSALYGIAAGAGSSLTNCSAYGNTGSYGIYAGNGSSLTNCSAFGNTSSMVTSAGISTGAGCMVSHCAAYNNLSTAATSVSTTGMGFSLGTSSTIHGCTAYSNRGDGINILSNSLVLENNCVSNGSSNGGNAAGVHATLSGNRIESNNVTGNDRGVDINAASNLIIKNTAKSNTTNYSIVANNVFGPIVDRTAAVAAAVNGNSAASSIVTTDPSANFAY